jgi:peroxiredoxin Q/BCP
MFDGLGVHIVGVSFDSPAANQTFAEQQNFEYELWSDDDKTLALYYGAASSSSASMPSRVTMLLDAEGTLILEYRSVSPASHPGHVLEDCREIFGP